MGRLARPAAYRALLTAGVDGRPGGRCWRIRAAVGYVGGAALVLGGLALVAVDPLDVRALLGAVLALLGAGVLDRLEREPPAHGG